MCSVDFFLAFLAIFFPPVSVWVKRGICSADSLINIALCILGYLPGLLHAWYIIAKYPEEASYTALEVESGGRHPHVYYFPPAAPGGPQYHPQSPGPQGHPQQGPFSPPPPHHGAYNTFAHQGQQQQQQQQQGQGQGQGQAGPSAQAGPSTGPNGENQGLPSYAEVVKGDFKVQTA